MYIPIVNTSCTPLNKLNNGESTLFDQWGYSRRTKPAAPLLQQPQVLRQRFFSFMFSAGSSARHNEDTEDERLGQGQLHSNRFQTFRGVSIGKAKYETDKKWTTSIGSCKNAGNGSNYPISVSLKYPWTDMAGWRITGEMFQPDSSNIIKHQT